MVNHTCTNVILRATLQPGVNYSAISVKHAASAHMASQSTVRLTHLVALVLEALQPGVAHVAVAAVLANGTA